MNTFRVDYWIKIFGGDKEISGVESLYVVGDKIEKTQNDTIRIDEAFIVLSGNIERIEKL